MSAPSTTAQLGKRGVRPAVTVLSLVVVAGLLAGCTSQNSGTTSGSDVATATIALDAPLKTMDPTKTTNVVDEQAMNFFAGTLVQSTKTGIGPGLAKSWKFSPDGLTFTVTLRSGLKFSNGVALTAKDVVASFERQLKDKANVNAGSLAPIKSVVAKNTTTAVFNLSAPTPSLPYVVTAPQYMIYPAGKVTKTSFYKNPISDGPYKIKAGTWNPVNGSITLVRNANYWGPAPVVTQLKLTPVPDEASRIAQLQSGQVQLAINLSPVAAKQATGKISAIVTTVNGGNYIYMNDLKAPLNNVNVRQAISLAIDRKQMATLAYGPGLTQPMDSFFPSTMSVYYPTIDIKQNIAKAKSLLKGTPCENGCTITDVNSTAASAVVNSETNVLKQQLAEIGITVNIGNVDNTVLSSQINGASYQMTVNGLSSGYNAPDGMLVLGVVSDGGIRALASGYNSPEMDKLAKTVISSGGSKRQAAVKKVQELFAKDMPYVPLVQSVYVNLTSLPKGTITQYPSGFFYVASK